jgi:hypothetical protein
MKSLKNLFRMALLTTICCASLGCGLTLGPQIQTTYVILHPGRPMQVLENKMLKGRVLDGSGDAVEQDVGGWVMMPFSHFEAVKRNLER